MRGDGPCNRRDDDPAAARAQAADGVVKDQFDRLVVDVADTRRVVRCAACGYKTSKVHETQRVEIRDLPQPLVWLQRRSECLN